MNKYSSICLVDRNLSCGSETVKIAAALAASHAVRARRTHRSCRQVFFSLVGQIVSHSSVFGFALVLLVTLQATITPCSAVTVLPGMILEKATNAPLAGVLSLKTDIPSRVAIAVDDGTTVWERNFYDYGTDHSVPLFGFKPGRTNEITVTVYDKYQNTFTAAAPLKFVTGDLPADFPNITLLQSDPSAMEPGYTLFVADVFYENGFGSQFYAIIVDDSGEVVWYNVPPPTFDIRQLENGNLFVTAPASFVEFNLLGQTVNSWVAPLLPLDIHEGLPTSHGTILYLNDAVESVPNFPSSVTDPNGPTFTADVLYQKVVEISMTNSEVVNAWSPIDVLDPRRASYLFNQATDGLPKPGWDTEHSNAIVEDPRDDSLIVSMRNQNAVVKISRKTGALQWILGPHENWRDQWQPYLLKPVGSPFAWQYGQHAPILTDRGTLILYDDGNFRSSPPDPTVTDSQNYTRAVEYSINESTMEVTQVWEYGSTNRGEWLYTGFEGNAEPEPRTGNVLIDFAAVSYVDGKAPSSLGPSVFMARFKEVTHDTPAEVVFDLAVTEYDKLGSPAQNCTVYRTHRIPDLYPHPVTAVADLSVSMVDGVAELRFSADDVWTYTIESSNDLADWKELGVPVESEVTPGQFDYIDPASAESPTRYYRVVTVAKK